MKSISSILITGGTGSFGKSFIKHLLSDYPNIKRIVIYSRDELKQFEMSEMAEFKENRHKLRYFIGDVRDRDRLIMACEDIDCIVHAAALKQVTAAEYNPMECIKTNILGAENVIHAALANNVKKVIALSTDKAAAPVNLYGATKLCSDKLFIAANNMRGRKNITFSVVRYGNVFGSRGSVVPVFLKLRESQEITITDTRMTRFSILMKDAIRLVVDATEIACGGEIFIPKIPSYKIEDLAEAIAPNCKKKIIGIRPGEKLHEEMITHDDSLNTLDLDNFYIIAPSSNPEIEKLYIKERGATKVPYGFSYSSGSNTEWLSVEQLREHLVSYQSGL